MSLSKIERQWRIVIPDGDGERQPDIGRRWLLTVMSASARSLATRISLVGPVKLVTDAKHMGGVH